MVHGFPVATAVRQVLPLLKLHLLQGAPHDCVAVAIHPVGEPRARDADLGDLAALDHEVVSVATFVHYFHESSASADVLALARLVGKAAVPVSVGSH